MRTKSFFTAVFVVVALCLIQTTVQGDDTRPGEKNPVNMSHPALFRDDELLIFAGFTDDHKIKYHYLWPAADDLTVWSGQATEHQFLSSEFSSTSRFRHIAAASGRIINPDKRDTAAYAFFRPDGKVEVELWDSQSGRMDRYITLDGTQVSERSVDVAVGDLDGAVDDNGMSHDEIVVVRTYGAGGKDLAIDVLDYNLNILGSHKFYWPDCAGMVAAGIGDFNGDRYPEVAVGMASYNKLVRQVSIYQFARDDKGNLISPLKFNKVSDNYFPQSPGFSCSDCANRSFDMTVGDFNGDGTDEIFIASSINYSSDNHYLDLSIFRSDQNLKLNVAWSNVQRLPLDRYHSSGTVPDGQLRAESGLFKFDPNNGWGLNRSQIALCYVEHVPGDDVVVCPILTVDNNLNAQISKIGAVGGSVDQIIMDIATGNFTGHGKDGKATSPLMDLAILMVSSWQDMGNYYKNYQLRIVRGPLQDCRQVYQTTFATFDHDIGLLPAITGIDGDGDTWRLGPSVHIKIENLIGLDYVIQEPPKHVDCLPDNPNDPNSCKLINVSTSDDFNVEFMESEGQSFSISSQKTSNWSIGGSTELNVKATVSAGIGDIAKVSVSGESDTKIGYNYESSKSHYNSNYAEDTYTFTSVTSKDDFISGRIQVMDIWRFPIIGYDTGDPKKPHAFQEIILPNKSRNDTTFKGGGLNKADWYQPVHQNHNLLSYPLIQQDKSFPPDLGSFTLPDGTVVNATMNDSKTVLYFDENKTHSQRVWTKEAGSGSDKHYNHTLSESEDIKVGASAEGTYLDGSVQVEASFSVGFHNENSWGGSESEETKSSNSTGITINVPSGDGRKGYAFQSAVYVSSGGGKLKVAHAVDPLGSTSGQDWWQQQYGKKPDPALNLPFRFVSSGGDWILNEEDYRMEMRGFFMRKFKDDKGNDQKNPVSGEYDLLGAPPTDGDIVKLCARVYNFSLHQPAGQTHPFGVLFEYILHDDKGGTEVGSRQTIGSTTTSLGPIIPDPSIGDPSMREVCVPWDTTGLSNTSYSYRFYVTVDPKDEVKNEIHEWKDANGNKILHGNNEGYWPWGQGITVQKKQSQSAQALSVQASSKPSVSMHIESLAIETPSGLKSKGPVRVYIGGRYRLRSHIVANEDHPHYHYTIFFDGPRENGKVIAVKTNFGMIDGDNYVWANWTPEETGIREIYVHFIEDLDDQSQGDAWDSLKVVVREEPISWRDEVIDRLMGVEE